MVRRSVDFYAVEEHGDETKREFVDTVLDIVGREGMKMVELAAASGLTPQGLNERLYHSRNSSLRTLCQIAMGLGGRLKITLERDDGEKI